MARIHEIGVHQFFFSFKKIPFSPILGIAVSTQDVYSVPENYAIISVDFQ
jgi:hypothetical protein